MFTLSSASTPPLLVRPVSLVKVGLLMFLSALGKASYCLVICPLAEVGLDRNCMFYSFTCQLSGVLPKERLAPFVTLAVINSLSLVKKGGLKSNRKMT